MPTRWLVGLIIFLCGLPFFPALIKGETLGPWRHINPLMNAEAPVPAAGFDVLAADGALQFYVWRTLVFEHWRAGEVPAINLNQLAGAPLLANSQSGALYPLHWLVGILGIPTGVGLLLLAWAHLAIAALGVRAWALRLGAGPTGAALGGLGFGLSAFLVQWSVIPSVPTTVAWIPWALWALAGARHHWLPSLVGSGTFLALMFLGGHLQFAFYGSLMFALYAVYLAIESLRERKGTLAIVGVSVAGAAMGAAMASGHLIPVLEYSRFSHRIAAPSEEGYQAFAGSAIQPWELIGLTAPSTLGAPGSTIYDDEREVDWPSFWPMFVKPGANAAESAIAIGPMVLFGLLLLLARRDPRPWIGPAILGAVGLLLALGTPLNRLLYYGIPGFSATGSPGRAAVIFVLAMCVVAACAWPRDEESVDEAHGKRLQRLSLIAAGIGVVLVLATVSLSGLTPWLPQVPVAFLQLEQLTRTLPWALGAGALLVVTATLWSRPGMHLAAAGAALGAHLMTSMVLHVVTGPTPDVPNRPVTGTSTERHAFINDNSWSFFGPGTTWMMPNLATLTENEDIGGYDSLLHRDTVNVLREINRGEDPAPPINGNMMLVKPGYDPVALGAAGVTQVHQRAADGSIVTEEVPGPGIASGRFGRVNLRRDRLKGEVDAFGVQGPTRLVVRYRNIPGWRAYSDGRPVTIDPESPWLEVDLPESRTYTVTFRYEGVPAWAGFTPWIAWLAMLATGTLAWGLSGAKTRPADPWAPPSEPKLEPTPSENGESHVN